VTSFEDILAGARLPETSVSLCLRGDLDAEWRELERKLQSASRESASLGRRSEASILAERVKALEAEMAASQVTFTMRADSAKRWSDFVATQPKRQKGETDEAWSGRWFDWMCQLISRACVEPAMTAEQVAQLCDVLSAAQWDDLGNGAWNLNARTTPVPFSLAASALTESGEQK
jgi:hypothetical protein